MRAIDADALKEDLVKDLANTMRMMEMHKGDMALRVLNKLDEASTLDVAPVVRCKDCVYSKPMPERGVPKFGADALNCTACRGDDGYGFYGISVVWPDDYCSDGAKMEGEK